MDEKINYDDDPLWRSKPLTPDQILVHDIRLEKLRHDTGPLLEIVERYAPSLVPELAAVTPSSSIIRATNAATNPIERQRFSALEEQYGWIRHLRILLYQRQLDDSIDAAKCRWIHCSSKFPEYLPGFLWALSEDTSEISSSMQLLDHVIAQQTRYSKHGKQFDPFVKLLGRQNDRQDSKPYPMLASVPFLDWSVLGPAPPLRFQVDRREGFASARSSAHIQRSLLQYLYRLEDTTEREASQVFAKHRPWTADRGLDLRVRGFYGRHPTAMIVDTLWILVIDEEHIVTFSGNQTWKSRWPPLQLTSRISDVAFRDTRNRFYMSGNGQDYTSVTHALVCLNGAVGMMHRSFWGDFVLPAIDRYAGHLSHLQYRLHRSPSTKLVMDLIAYQEELNIVIQVTQQQLDMISSLKAIIGPHDEVDAENMSPTTTNAFIHGSRASRRMFSESTTIRDWDNDEREHGIRRTQTFRQISTSQLTNPIAQLIENLERELTDLTDLRNNADRLVTRTIQLVNIRLEDHGKAIMVFTIVTLIFLPLNFISSFFGMNFIDIRETNQTQWLFWTVGLCVTAFVVAASIFFAFSGADLLDMIHAWRDGRQEQQHGFISKAKGWIKRGKELP